MLTHDLCVLTFYSFLVTLNCVGWFLMISCEVFEMSGRYTIYKMNEKDVCDDYGEC